MVRLEAGEVVQTQNVTPLRPDKGDAFASSHAFNGHTPTPQTPDKDSILVGISSEQDARTPRMRAIFDIKV
ncbi:MAG: hypothetical protein RID09_10625 [Coleofasciculus sp. G1-WW12-02]|uniref:hypothetical protein n=1 Tax=unclassified Coleofasciculus TaxID=2692782 RepID=UPI0032F48420